MPVLNGSRAAGWGPRAGGGATGFGAGVVASKGAARSGRVVSGYVVAQRCRGRVPGRLRPGGGARVRPTVTRPAVSACMVRRPAVGWRVALAVAASVCAVTVGFGAVVGGLAGGVASAVPESTTVVAVAPGESLWQLAERYAPGVDTSAVVARIEELNGVSTGEVTAGAVLSVPISRG
ncbi:LysM peptidoglycan-binding domain-containing protein [Haloechinothrix salitolerans]|uniref:LysM peptidoglycan-binding domain-containing protein n=1 Tax=Haloechinothrix salitolerans TaxID=926830 RepID=A0ABW2C501_9PSEU